MSSPSQVHQETFGKSGCRRIVPGQYLAVDPKGRAIMIGMVEFHVYIYILFVDLSIEIIIAIGLEVCELISM